MLSEHSIEAVIPLDDGDAFTHVKRLVPTIATWTANGALAEMPPGYLDRPGITTVVKTHLVSPQSFVTTNPIIAEAVTGIERVALRACVRVVHPLVASIELTGVVGAGAGGAPTVYANPYGKGDITLEWVADAPMDYANPRVTFQGISDLPVDTILGFVEWVDSGRRESHHNLQLNVKSATVTLNEGWAPYAQATLVCTMPASEVLAQIDPRLGIRATLTMRQSFGEAWPLSDITAQVGSPVLLSNVTSWFAGRALSAAASTFGTGYNATGPRASKVRRLDLGIRARSVSVVDGTMTLTLASDEALLQDAALVSATSVSPVGTNLAAACNLALARIGATLTETQDVADLAADSLVWEPGVSAWDYTLPLASASNRRLWCDEQRVWRLINPASMQHGALRVTATRTSTRDGIDRDGDWCDAVVVTYRWADSGGLEQTRVEVAGPASATRVKHVTVDRPLVREGLAAAMLARSSGRELGVEAVSDYTATPGQVVTIDLPDGTTHNAIASAVTWSFTGSPGSDHQMSIATRDATEIVPGSYGQIPADVTYGDIPAGLSWSAYVTTLGG